MLLNNFYTINNISYNDAEILADISLNPKHEIYQGHFPESPVLPGVCLMTIAKEVIIEATKINLVLAESKSLKFLGMVNPNVQPNLQVKVNIKQQNEKNVDVNCQIINADGIVYKASSNYKIITNEQA